MRRLIWHDFLILRAGINRDAGEHLLAFPDLQEAFELLDEHEQPYLWACAHYHLTETYIRIGDFEAAAEALPKARELCRGLDNDIAWYQLLWLTGLVQQGQGDETLAEGSLAQAHEGFVELDERGYAAVIALDRAILYKKQDRHPEVLELASEAIPVLEGFKIHREAFAALRLLREALQTQDVTVAVLHKVRACLYDLLDHPLAQAPE